MKLRAGDFIAGALVVALALGIWVCLVNASEKGDTVTVSRNGRIIYKAPLSEERVIELSECEVRISENRARVTNPTCPDKVCERCGEIENAGDIIICVPNRISVEISGNKSFDAIVS